MLSYEGSGAAKFLKGFAIINAVLLAIAAIAIWETATRPRLAFDGGVHIDRGVDASPGGMAIVATVSLEPAGTRVRGRHQREASRKLHHPTAPRHDDAAVLERLAQTLHRVPPEFRELVQEQDTVVGERA
jgi:hypothetical protein